MAIKKTTTTTTTKSAAPIKSPAASKPAPVITSAKAPAASVASKGAVRNTAVPRAASIARIVEPKEITFDLIAKRAYEIHCSGTGGSQDDNWFRAERELRGGL
jgi:hypothetical protein